MNTMIEATVKIRDWDERSLENAIIENAACQLIEKLKIEDRLANEIQKQLNKRLDDLLRDLFDQEVQPTNKWGEKTGPSIRIREQLQRDAEKWLLEPVDDRGNSSTGRYNNQTRLQYLIKDQWKEMKKGLEKQTREEIAALLKKLSAKIDSELLTSLRRIAGE